MKLRLKKYPVFAGVLAALLLVLAAEGWCLWARAAAAHAARRRVQQQEGQLRQLADTVPPPTGEMAAQIERDLARTRAALAAMQAELRGRGPVVERVRKTRPPERRTDAFFDLASFVERTRDRARRAGVGLADGEMFGFSLYAHTGPEPDLIPAVFQQRLIAQYLVEALIDARPRQILSFLRERPLSPQQRAARAQAEPAGSAPGEPANPPDTPDDASIPDLFTLEPRFSARAPGFVDTQAYRATFVGHTATLRTFLNKLAGYELPLVVRQVEVAPFTAEAADPAATAVPPDSTAPILIPNDAARSGSAVSAAPAEGRAGAPVPLVPRSLAKFIVTVEFVELVPPPAADNATATPEKSAPAPR